MTATVTASIASLILTIPVQTDYDTYEEGLPVGSEVIQDVATVKVWASTTSGFTPNDTNLVFAGKTLTIVIANLTPLTTYYLKYAFISEVDPDNIEYSAELSGTPNKIDGSIVVDGSVTTAQLAAGAVTTSKLSVQGRNMLTDIDSFEQYLGKAPPGSSGSATITTSQDFAYHGGWSLKHVSTATNSYKYLNPTGNNANAWVRLEVGKVYIVSAYVRTTSASATSVALYAGPFEFGTTTAAGTAQTATLSISASQGWQRISVVISSVTGTNPAMRFYCRNSSSGITTYWDGFMIEERVGTDNTPSPFTPGGTTVIDGGNIVADTITASQISATALRGKQITGNILMDRGSLVTGNVNIDIYTGTVTTTYTIPLQDTLDFPPVGAFIHIPAHDQWTGDYSIFRYTGKTSTSLTGCSGIFNITNINVGDVIMPVSACSEGGVASYDGLGELNVGYYNFRTAGGNAVAIKLDYNTPQSPADFFTYTGMETTYPALLGVSGLAAWSDGIERAVFDNPGFPTVTISTAGDITSLTTNTSNNAYIPEGGGLIALVSTTASYYPISFASYSGTTINLSGVFTINDTGTYTVVPLQNLVCSGASLPLVTYSNAFGYYSWQTGSAVIYQNQLVLRGQSGINAATATLFNQRGGPSIYAGSAVSCLPLQLEPISGDDVPTTGWAPFDGSFASNFFKTLGPVYAPANLVDPADSTKSYLAYVDYDDPSSTPKAYFYQPISNTLHFSASSNVDSITFDDATNTYNFNADNGDGNAYIRAYHAALGNAAISSSAVINATQSMSVNATRYGMNNVLTITNTTLTADRTIRGAYNSVQLQYQNAAAFSANAYGSYNEAATSTTSGNSLDGEGQLYGSFNYALHNTDDATYKRIEAAYGSYDHVYSAGDTSLIDNAYGVFAYVRSGGTAAAATTAITTAYGIYGYVNAGAANRNIGTAFLLYLTSGETGTVTTKWGVYVASTWPNFFNGNVILDGSVNYTPTVVTPVAAGTTTLTTGTSIVVCNHTATIASHTFTFPSTSLTNGQQITITARSAITTVTLSGGTFRGAITTLAAGGFAQYTYSSTAAAWFRTS